MSVSIYACVCRCIAIHIVSGIIKDKSRKVSPVLGAMRQGEFQCHDKHALESLRPEREGPSVGVVTIRCVAGEALQWGKT